MSAATGLSDQMHTDQMHTDIYDYFSRASAWTVTEGAVEALRHLKQSGESFATRNKCSCWVHSCLPPDQKERTPPALLRHRSIEGHRFTCRGRPVCQKCCSENSPH